MAQMRSHRSIARPRARCSSAPDDLVERSALIARSSERRDTSGDDATLGHPHRRGSVAQSADPRPPLTEVVIGMRTSLMSKLVTLASVVGLTVVVASQAAAQRRVTGHVTETNGQPVANAAVQVQNTTLGAITGDDGRFTITNVPNGQQVFIARRIGYHRATQLLPSGAETIEIHLD